jgi:anti-sigma factor RsiW
MQLSAYVDGELPESEAELLLRRLSQDASLRAELAEFLEIGRRMRGEPAIPGIHALRGRVAAAIDSDDVLPEPADVPEAKRSLAKPVGGVAIAASVALVAVLGLQQSADVGNGTVAGEGSVDTPAVEYVVPPEDSELREFMRMHGETSSEQGANGMNVRIVSFPLREDEVADEEEPAAVQDEPDAPVEPDAGVE